MTALVVLLFSKKNKKNNEKKSVGTITRSVAFTENILFSAFSSGFTSPVATNQCRNIIKTDGCRFSIRSKSIYYQLRQLHIISFH